MPIPQVFHINNDSAISGNFRKDSFAKIFAFARKFSRNFRENFAKMRKWNFRFGPNGNWILALPHICLFYPPKMRCYEKNHACRITIKFNGFFVSAKISAKFLWDFRETKFRENRSIFAWLSHFPENWKMHFRFNPSLDTTQLRQLKMRQWS
jgi:hypothetical protein